MTKSILMAVSALSLLAAPAFAQTSTVSVGGTVAGECGVGYQSGGGSAPDNSSLTIADMTGANGFLDTTTEHTIQFGNMWCNGPSKLNMKVNQLIYGGNDTGDASSFVSAVDMIVSGTNESIFNYFGGANSVRSGPALEVSRTGAFESGTGQYAQAKLKLALPTATSGQDRPRAGEWAGSVVLTISPTS